MTDKDPLDIPEVGPDWFERAKLYRPRYGPDLRVVLTAGVYDRAAQDPAFRSHVSRSLARHARGDWGELDETDKAKNDSTFAAMLGAISAFETPEHPKIYIITDPGHAVITVLFPDEY